MNPQAGNGTGKGEKWKVERLILIPDHRTPRFTGLLKARSLKCMGIYRSSIKWLTNAHKLSWVIKLHTAYRDTLNHRYEVSVFTSTAVYVHSNCLIGPCINSRLNKPFLIPSQFSKKFDESASHCWRYFKMLFPGVITLNKRSMDWEQNYCRRFSKLHVKVSLMTIPRKSFPKFLRSKDH